MKKSDSSFLNRVLLLLLLASFALSVFYKLAAISNNNSAFTMDQGRDMLDIRHMVVTVTPRLVGPTTSINGVLLGPFWYYFNLIPFVVSGGSPSAILIWQILWFHLAAFVLYSVLKKVDKVLAVVSTVLFLLMPTGFYTARYFWNANSMPFFTAIFFSTLLWFLFDHTKNRHNLKLLILGFISGLCLQIEAAFGILFFPFSFLVITVLSFPRRRESINKFFLDLGLLTSGFLTTLLPQILFEFRHGFQMTKIFFAESTGNAAILGQKLTFSERLSDRIFYLTGLLRDTSHIPERFLFPLYIILLLLLVISLLNKKLSSGIRSYFTVLFSFLIFAFVFYLIFPQALKIWYLLGLSVPFVLLFSLSLYALFKISAKYHILSILFVSMVIISAFFETAKAQSEYLNTYTNKPSTDQSQLQNQLSVIDYVYKQANGKGFKVYSFVPSIYDFSYQYLFWWYGTKTYGYQPDKIAYLPGQPEYIKDNDIFWTKKIPAENDLTFLLIEKSDNLDLYNRWMGNFAYLCKTESKIMPFNLEIQILNTCPQGAKLNK